MPKAYENQILVTNEEYDISQSTEGWTEVRVNKEYGLDISVVRFNMRGNDIYLEFGESGILQLLEVPIKYRARLVRERFIKLFFMEGDEILVTMPMF